MVTRIKTATNVLEHKFGNEAVILNLTTETYYTLNGVAIDMWRALKSSETVEQALEALLNEYDVDRDTLSTDLQELVTSLKQANLVEVEAV